MAVVKCDCISNVDEHLASHNTKIELPMFGPQRPFIVTRKLDDKKRGKPVRMFASFCPFCGVKYQEENSRSSRFLQSREATHG